MKLEITLASGTRLTFEGERADFDHMADLLDLPGILGAEFKSAPSHPAGGNENGEGDGGGPGSIDARKLAERLARAGASKHTERLAVMAQEAVEAGREGLDFATAEQLYRQIGEPRPANWKSAFSNARVAGLIHNAGRGRWRPTPRGENYALYGVSGQPGARGSRDGEEAD